MAPGPLERKTVGMEMAAILRREILGGALRPGDPLPEQKLAVEYRASRPSVRDALRLLEHEGLVQHSTHRGSRVTRLTSAERRDIQLARLVIEPQVVRTYNDDQALAHLGRLANVLESAASKNDWPAYVNADIEFHVSLVGLAGSTCLTEFHAIIMRRLRLQLLSVDLDGFDEGPERLHVKEHRNIVERLQAGDRQGAARVLTRHLEAALVALI